MVDIAVLAVSPYGTMQADGTARRKRVQEVSWHYVFTPKMCSGLHCWDDFTLVVKVPSEVDIQPCRQARKALGTEGAKSSPRSPPFVSTASVHIALEQGGSATGARRHYQLHIQRESGGTGAA